MKTSFSVCVLAALLATGACLQCEVCQGQGTSCTGNLETCPSGHDSCAVAVTEAALEGVKVQLTLKGCLPSSQCQAIPISMNFGNGMTTRSGITRCVGDACRTVNVTVPAPDTTPNGRRCPACYALPPEQCQEETIDCTGAATQCIHLAETITAEGNPVPILMKGCASQFLCNQIQVGAVAIAGLGANITEVKCTAASRAAGRALPTSQAPLRPHCRDPHVAKSQLAAGDVQPPSGQPGQR
ncbi:phospholipase A2 inhibitor gamma subunit B-like [Carettochelys insculpta]|uniref:phospholipase A2 inhibitor gamma subunit B-like n=1 Tax=Carettochelys insculpta TaxID=44489 RepID=UPI003EBD976E